MSTAVSGHEKLTMAQALNRALRDAMTEDDNHVVLAGLVVLRDDQPAIDRHGLQASYNLTRGISVAATRRRL